MPTGGLVPQVTALDMETWTKANKGQSPKPKAKISQSKVPQFREEMIIRNSDSGKSKTNQCFWQRRRQQRGNYNIALIIVNSSYGCQRTQSGCC